MSFPTTRRSIIAATASNEPALRREAIDAIISAYWKPVYNYVCWKWQKPPEDARDMTQDFFTSAIDHKLFQRYDPGRALFRTYIRTCVDNHLRHQIESDSRIKRGGAVEIIPIDDNTQSAEPDMEAYFHREWMRQLFTLAVDDLRSKCEQENKHIYFHVFELYDLATERPTYDALASTLRITTTEVTNYLAWARRQLRQLLLDRLAGITGGESEYNQEVRFLLGWERR